MQVCTEASLPTKQNFLLARVFFHMLLRLLLGSLRLPSLPFVKINVAMYNLPDSALSVSWYRELRFVHTVLFSRRLKPLSLAAASI